MEVPEFATPPQPEPLTEVHKGRIAAHPYLTTLIGTALLILIGIVFVFNHGSASVTQTQLDAWGGVSGLPTNPTINAPQSVSQNAPPQIEPQNSTIGSSTEITLSPMQTLGADQSAADAAASDLDTLLAQLSTPASSAKLSSSSSNSLIADAYALIPRGLVATTSMSQAKLTRSQSALYQYGNDAGSVIQTYEYTHQNVAQILQDQAADRTDPDKATAVTAIGKALIGVGKGLAKLDSVPDAAVSYNSALASGYEDIGAKLTLIAQAQTDSQFLSAVQTYNSSVDSFNKSYIALANYFNASGVSFSPDDSGSVFSFKPVTF